MSKLLDRARELELEGNLEVALTYYEMAREDKSSPADIRKDFGRILNKLANYNEALDCFNLVLSMNTDYTECWFGKGISNLGLNNWEESLSSFKKALTLDENNANFYYYIAIILKEFGNDNANKYYNKFLELDNDYFKTIRQPYKFGLIFEQNELYLKNSNKQINIDGYKDILNSFGLSDDEIIYFLRVLPLNKLKEKITLFNDLNHENYEKNVIFNELSKLGLDNEDINNLFEIDTIENIKKDIISRCEVNPFKDKENLAEIPFYIVESEDKFSDICSKFIIFEITRGKFKFHKSCFIKPISCVKNRYYINLLYKIEGNIKKKEYNIALNMINFEDLSKISDSSLKNKFIFYKASLLAINNDFECALNNFKQISSDNPIYLFNKENVLYNLDKIESINLNSLKYVNDNFKRLEICSTKYKSDDLKKALKYKLKIINDNFY